MSRKACKQCKFFYEGNECPACKGNQAAASWQGRVNVLDSEKSKIAEMAGFKKEGEYAISVR